MSPALQFLFLADLHDLNCIDLWLLICMETCRIYCLHVLNGFVEGLPRLSCTMSHALFLLVPRRETFGNRKNYFQSMFIKELESHNWWNSFVPLSCLPIKFWSRLYKMKLKSMYIMYYFIYCFIFLNSSSRLAVLEEERRLCSLCDLRKPVCSGSSSMYHSCGYRGRMEWY